MLFRWVRRLARKGWSAGDIASIYQVSKADVLSMLAPVVVKPPNPKRPGACFKKHNSWSDAARIDPRFRDPVSTLEAPAAAIAAALVERPARSPGPAADPPPPIAESWGSVHASGPRKITAAVLARALELHRQGRSWPSIAAELGCHRQSLYFARKRASGNM